MSNQPQTVLVVGANGSIGRLVVNEAISRGLKVKALVRSEAKAKVFSDKAEVVIGDLTKSDDLKAALDDADAVVFTQGSNGSSAQVAEAVDLGAVENALSAIGERQVRIALMTAIGVTNPRASFASIPAKLKSEELVRSSGLPYTIVRPGWFDYNEADHLDLQFLQGDTRQTGTPADGAISRRQIAQVLVDSFLIDDAIGKTFELVAESGPAQTDLQPLFAALKGDN